ncbi:hypothetical protein PAPHI01_2823, partial [Pancytospora philotis]
MALRTSSKTCDGYAWACINRGCPKRRTTLSIRHRSVFSYSRVTLFRLFELIYLWAREIPINSHEALDLVRVNRKTLGEMYARLQSLVIENAARTPVRLGGHGVLCQIDESLFCHKQKYHVGRVAEEQVWVFGIADTS